MVYVKRCDTWTIHIEKPGYPRRSRCGISLTYGSEVSNPSLEDERNFCKKCVDSANLIAARTNSKEDNIMLYKKLLEGKVLRGNPGSGIIHIVKRGAVNYSYCGSFFSEGAGCKLNTSDDESKLCKTCLKSVKAEKNWPDGNDLITVKYTTTDGKEFDNKKDALDWVRQRELSKRIAEWVAKKLRNHRWRNNRVYRGDASVTIQEAIIRFLTEHTKEVKQLLE